MKDSIHSQRSRLYCNFLPKFLRISKLVFFYLAIGSLQVSANAYSQKITIHEKNAPLSRIFKTIKKQSGYLFLYNNGLIEKARPVTLDVNEASIDQVLEKCFAGQPVTYTILDKTIILKPKEPKEPAKIKSDISSVDIKGRVVDEKGEPLPGVSINLKGTTIGTTTDGDGRYTISGIQEKGILVFSFIGYAPVESSVNNKTVLDIALTPEVKSLSEVVVVGYGTQKKRDVSGAIASLNNADIKDIPVYSMENSMQGRAAGVNITTSSATPGGGINVNIRGVTSFSASSQPLYVIDGIPITSGSNSQLGGTMQPANPMADINPNDIESIEILKDASSAAIYGSRGSNGVILITTKRGKEGKTEVDFGYYAGTQKISHIPEMMNSKQWIEFMNVAAKNDGKESNYFSTPGSKNFIGDPNDPNLVNTRIYDEIFRTAPMNNYEVSLRGGSAKTKFFGSANYFDQEGIQIGQGFQRATGRVNLEQEITKKIKFGTNIMLSRSTHQRTESEGGLYGVVVNAQAWVPTQPIYNPDGTYTDPFKYSGWWALENPVLIAKEVKRGTQSDRALGSAFLNYQILPSLTLHQSVSIDFNNTNDQMFTPSFARRAKDSKAAGMGEYGSSKSTSWLNEGVLTYTKNFNKIHDLSITTGYSIQEVSREFSLIQGQNFPNDKLQEMALAAQVTRAIANDSTLGLVSTFGRVNYGLKDRYLATVTVRRDGSSRFGSNTRYGTFPSASLAWRLIDEPFMQILPPRILSDLKIRGSYGLTGNQEGIANYAWRGLWNLNSAYRGIGGSAPARLENPDLSWEKTTQTDIGIDLGFLNHRVSVTADYFVKNTTDLLMERDIPGSLGFNTVYSNVGAIQNKGFEFGFNTVNTVGTFKWTTNFNISAIKNEVVDVISDGQQIGRFNILKEGEPLSSFFLVKFLGVNPDNGDAIWEDLNKDGNINQDDRQIAGNANPDYFGGLTNNFFYKNFDLSVFFHFVQGNEIFNQSRFAYEQYGSLNSGIPYGNSNVRSLNYWKQPGDKTDIPRPSLAGANTARQQYYRFSTQYVEDGSFVRLKTVRLGYTLPQSLAGKAHLRNVKLYVLAQNLFTWTKYLGFDPEVSSNMRTTGGLNNEQGVDFGTVGQARTFTFGINIGI